MSQPETPQLPQGTEPEQIVYWFVGVLMFFFGAGSLGAIYIRWQEHRHRKADRKEDRWEVQEERTHELDKLVDQRILDRLTYQDKEISELRQEIKNLKTDRDTEFTKRIETETNYKILSAKIDVLKASGEELRQKANECFEEKNAIERELIALHKETERCQEEIKRLEMIVNILERNQNRPGA